MMDLPLREPVSALTHGMGAILAVVGTVALWRRGRSAPDRRPGLAVFGVALAACFASSARYHAAIGPDEHVQWLRRLDHVGIFGLIAGTYTPVACGLLRGRWRAWTLGLAWGTAAAGSLALLAGGLLPAWLSTSIYLAFGWWALAVLLEIARTRPPRTLRLLVGGGVLYSLGAAVHLAGWPDAWPGVVGPHEVFHLFVLAGAACHFAFVGSIAADALPSPPAPAARPRHLRIDEADRPQPRFALRRTPAVIGSRREAVVEES